MLRQRITAAVRFSTPSLSNRPGCAANLGKSWIPALDRVREELEAGCRVADTPASRSREVGPCLGAQAGESRLHEVVRAGGFTRFRRAMQAPFNLVLEGRP